MMFAASLLVAVAGTAAPPEPSAPVPITVYGRDYLGLERQEQIITGTCDGVASSARIAKAYRKGDAGAIELRHGSRSRALPSSFARGLLVLNTAYQVGLGCDGERLLFVAHVIEMRGGPAARYFSQQATWNFNADSLVLSEPVEESAEEFAAHVR
jgi:hypothetical protein